MQSAFVKNILRKEVKRIKKLIVLFLIICLFPFSAAASSGEGWYFKPGTGRPVCFGGAKWVTDKGALFLGRDGDKKVYLTFDAGYGNESVRAIAQTLMDMNATAAFFILPAFADTDGELIKTLDEKGYFICNHSYSHGNMARASASEFEKELTKAEEHVYEKTGVKMKKYFRPPEGTFSPEMLDNATSLGYKTVFWSFAYADWDNSKQKDAEWAYQKIMSSLHDGMVLLLHPNSTTNAAILSRLITDIRAQGYEFGNLDELCVSQYGEQSTGNFVCGNTSACNTVAIIFDDGAHPQYTPSIPDVLKQYNAKTVLSTVCGGDIVLLRDYVSGISSTPSALREIIPRLLDKGYRFATVSSLLAETNTEYTPQEQ